MFSLDRTDSYSAPLFDRKVIRWWRQTCEPRTMDMHFPGLLFAALATVLAAVVPCRADWVTRHHNEAPWDTTGAPADLDAEVALGARILQYADGTYVHAVHRQYPQACGPAALGMVLRQLGFDEPRRPLELPRNVDALPGAERATVDVGYFGSMEHLMWLGYHRARLQSGGAEWNADDPLFLAPSGELNTAPGNGKAATLGPNGELDYLGLGKPGRIPEWLWRGPAVGTGGDSDSSSGLPGIMNYLVAGAWGKGCRDARPLTAFSRTDDEVRAFRRIVKGFVDHGISLLLGVESGGHFNVVIGYRGDTEDMDQPFFLYTADPLDGWGRPDGRLPGRWRRLKAVKENLFNGSKLLYQYVCWNQHLNGGCDEGGWAREGDRLNRNDWLCGRPVPAEDPLRDPLCTQADLRGSRLPASERTAAGSETKR
jgi:hypothetical protein